MTETKLTQEILDIMHIKGYNVLQQCHEHGTETVEELYGLLKSVMREKQYCLEIAERPVFGIEVEDIPDAIRALRGAIPKPVIEQMDVLEGKEYSTGALLPPAI